MTVTNKKHLEFIDQYFINSFNGTDAYLATYPKAAYNTARANAAKLLADTNISAEIDQRLREKHLDAVSVLARMSDLALSDIVQFADVRRVSDLKNPQYAGRTHVIKKFKSKITHDQLGRMIEEVELELYGADGMLDKMARVHGLYKDKLEVSWRDKLPEGFDPDEVKDQFVGLMKLAKQNASSG